jgi:hypothetical protein
MNANQKEAKNRVSPGNRTLRRQYGSSNNSASSRKSRICVWEKSWVKDTGFGSWITGKKCHIFVNNVRNGEKSRPDAGFTPQNQAEPVKPKNVQLLIFGPCLPPLPTDLTFTIHVHRFPDSSVFLCLTCAAQNRLCIIFCCL